MVFHLENDTNTIFFFLLFPFKLELSYFKDKSISISASQFTCIPFSVAITER